MVDDLIMGTGDRFPSAVEFEASEHQASDALLLGRSADEYLSRGDWRSDGNFYGRSRSRSCGSHPRV